MTTPRIFLLAFDSHAEDAEAFHGRLKQLRTFPAIELEEGSGTKLLDNLVTPFPGLAVLQTRTRPELLAQALHVLVFSGAHFMLLDCDTERTGNLPAEVWTFIRKGEPKDRPMREHPPAPLDDEIDLDPSIATMISREALQAMKTNE